MNEETQRFIAQHLDKDIREVALLAAKQPSIDASWAIQQIQGYRIAQKKIPLWAQKKDILYPPHLSMEQCSSQQTALFKASIVAGDTLLDLTGGWGVDCAFMSDKFKKTIYVENNTELAQIASSNFIALGKNSIQVVVDSCENFLQQHKNLFVDAIYIDPARRKRNGNRATLLQDYTPRILEIFPLMEQRAKQIMVKLSPMIDITALCNQLPHLTDIYVVGVRNEVKEILAVKNALSHSTTHPVIHCVSIQKEENQSLSFTLQDESTAKVSYTNNIQSFVHIPSAVILKAGAYKTLASLHQIEKLHPNTHIYTSADALSAFHGRSFRVIEIFSFSKSDIKTLQQQIQQANIVVRNFPLPPHELQKKLKIKEGGKHSLIATTLWGEKKVLIWAEVAHDEVPSEAY